MQTEKANVAAACNCERVRFVAVTACTAVRNHAEVLGGSIEEQLGGSSIRISKM